MASATDEQEGRTIERRTLLHALGAMGSVGLAGCGGAGTGDGDGGGDGSGGDGGSEGDASGERVPDLAMEYWSNLGGGTQIFENMGPVLAENLGELGVNVELVPVDFSAQMENTLEDLRTHELSFWYHSNTPDRLDPQEMTRRFSIDWSGGNGQDNPPNYANCEFTHAAVNQEAASSEEKRREFVNEAHTILSEDYGTIPIVPTLEFGAARTDELELGGVGRAGITRTNPHFYIQSETDRDRLVAADTPVLTETTNYPTIVSSGAQGPWNHLINSTLTEYDENFELKNTLAKEYETSRDGKRITVELKDARFSNGDPITSEDVKFTYEQLANNPGAYAQATSPPYDSIEPVDEVTTEFNFSNPYLPLITKVWPRWGIMHKQTWVEGGAPENPEQFQMDPIIGSGPFKVESFKQGSRILMTPNDGHPEYDPGHDLVLNAFRNTQTMTQALEANEIQLAPNLSPGNVDSLEGVDGIDTVVTKGFVPFLIYPQYPVAPTKFREFRKAIAGVFDRNEANEVAMRGQSEPELQSCPITDVHPWRPPDEDLTRMADDPEGSPENAREILQSAGWSWDDEGNLHYPPDKDLSPRWPKGEIPDASEFPCLSPEGEYVAE